MVRLAYPTRAWLLSPLAPPVTAFLASVAAVLPPLVLNDPLQCVEVPAFVMILCLAIRAPFAAAMTFYALSAFRLPEAFPMMMNIGIPRLAGAAVLLALAFKFLVSRERFIDPAPQVFLLGGFFAAASLGLFTSTLADTVWTRWSDDFIKAILAGLAIAILGHQRSHISAISWVSILSGLLLAPIVIWNKIFRIELVEGTRAVAAPGANSILADPNFTAQVLIVPLGLAVAIAAVSTKASLRLLAGACSLVFMAAIIATQSRGGLIGVVAVLSIVASMVIRSRLAIIALTATTASIVAVLMGLGARVSGGYDEISDQGLDASASQRLIAWKAALNMAVANPISGVGLGTFQQNFFYYADTWVGRAMDTHSTWFKVLGEIGFFGFACYFLMMATSFAAIYKALKTTQCPTLKVHAIGSLAAAGGFFATATFISSAVSGLAFGVVGTSVLLLSVVRRNRGDGQPIKAWTVMAGQQRGSNKLEV